MIDFYPYIMRSGRSIPMNDASNSASDDMADEEILTYAVTDEALEAAAGTQGYMTFTSPCGTSGAPSSNCC